MNTVHKIDDNTQTIELDRDNAPALRFVGRLLGKVSSSPDRAMESWWSGRTGRWTTLSAYITVKGQFVCHRISHTQWSGERDAYECTVVDDVNGIFEFFGHDWLAKELYAEMDLDDIEDI